MKLLLVFATLNAAMKPTLSPYLTFDGKTAEAMKFYQSVLGGELRMQTFEESAVPTTPEDKDKIVHADLKNDSLSFMASDGNEEKPVKMMGDTIQLSIVGSDEALLTKYFNRLAEDGKVDLPLAKQFWGDVYGQLTDKFGVHWMVNITSDQAKK